jgi:FMN phosphatase YigB (HAD superfamily)
MNAQHEKFSTIIFDLDDTLLNTFQLITQGVMRDVFQFLIDTGLRSTINDGFEFRKRYVQSRPKEDFFACLAKEFAPYEKQDSITQAAHKFYSEKLETLDFKLTDTVLSLLAELKANFDLYLVTAGKPARQEMKVKRLKIESFFNEIFYVDLSKGNRKRDAFLTIVNNLDASPSEVLAVGNRIDMEIAEAKSIGLKTALVLTGEYRVLRPITDEEVPDYTFESIEEIRSLCLR